MIKYALFNNEDFQIDFFDLVNYNRLIKICSSHLILPSLYFNLFKKNKLKFIDKDLSNYLKKIYKINLDRNRKLIEESNQITDLFYKSKIDYCFLKGTALVLGKYFINEGERMIGDIDILVNPDHFEKAIKILRMNNYLPKIEYPFFEKKSIHYPRLINKSKTFAVEIHKSIIDDVKHSLKILDSKVKINDKIYIPCVSDMIEICIYNHQFSDNGIVRGHHHLRTYYDLKVIEEKSKIKLPLNNNNLVFTRFFKVLNSSGYNFYNVKNNKKDYFFNLRIKLKKTKFFYFIDRMVIKTYLVIILRLGQLKEFTLNSNYRTYILKKKKYFN